VWIRTCYAADLQDTWKSIFATGIRSRIAGVAEEHYIVLDNEDLYDDCGEDWAKVFLRLPLFPEISDYDDDLGQDVKPDYCERHDDETYDALHAAARLEEQTIHLVDEQALRWNLVKLIHLDVYGKVVWYNMIAPKYLKWYEAYYTSTGTLNWHVELACRIGWKNGVLTMNLF
jgi:hypothetical protein